MTISAEQRCGMRHTLHGTRHSNLKNKNGASRIVCLICLHIKLCATANQHIKNWYSSFWTLTWTSHSQSPHTIKCLSALYYPCISRMLNARIKWYRSRHLVKRTRQVAVLEPQSCLLPRKGDIDQAAKTLPKCAPYLSRSLLQLAISRRTLRLSLFFGGMTSPHSNYCSTNPTSG